MISVLATGDVSTQQVHVCLCMPALDRVPHCCSDASSLCPHPVTITSRLLFLSWGLGSLGLFLPPSPPSPAMPCPYSGSNAQHPPSCSQCDVLSLTDLSLLTSGYGLVVLTAFEKVIFWNCFGSGQLYGELLKYAQSINHLIWFHVVHFSRSLCVCACLCVCVCLHYICALKDSRGLILKKENLKKLSSDMW